MSRRTETAYKAIIRASQHDMTKSHGFRRNGKCCGCVATVHVLIRGDLSGKPPQMFGAAPCMATCRVTGQESAEAIVGAGRCHQRSGNWKQAGIESRKPYPAEGPNEEEEVNPNELS